MLTKTALSAVASCAGSVAIADPASSPTPRSCSYSDVHDENRTTVHHQGTAVIPVVGQDYGYDCS